MYIYIRIYIAYIYLAGATAASERRRRRAARISRISRAAAPFAASLGKVAARRRRARHRAAGRAAGRFAWARWCGAT